MGIGSRVDTALIEISKAPASGAAGTRQRGYACKLSIGELPGQRKRYGARSTWVWRTLNAISQAIHKLPSNRRRPERDQGISKHRGPVFWNSTKGIEMARTRFEASIEKRAAVKDAEASGQVADSMDVRRALIDRMHKGEITLAEAQAQLKTIQSGAKRAGLLTRAQAFSRG